MIVMDYYYDSNDVSSLDYAETMYHAMKRNKAWSAVCKIFM